MPANVFFGVGAAFALVAAGFAAELFVAVGAAGFLVVVDLPVVVVFAFAAGFFAAVALVVVALVVAVFAGRALVAGLVTAFAGLFCSHYVNHHITCFKSDSARTSLEADVSIALATLGGSFTRPEGPITGINTELGCRPTQ